MKGKKIISTILVSAVIFSIFFNLNGIVMASDDDFGFAYKINLIEDRDKKLNTTKPVVIACDTHFERFNNEEERSPKSIILMNSVNEKLKCPFATIMGDYLTEYDKKIEDKDTLKEKYEIFRKLALPNTFIVKGNHDDTTYVNSDKADKMADTEILWKYAMEGKKSIKVNHKDPYGYYYYFNDEKSKVRHIFLNTIDIPYIMGTDNKYKYTGGNNWALRQEQLEWFANEALKVPEEYTVCVYSHHLIGSSNIDNDLEVINKDIAVKVLEDFKNGNSTEDIQSVQNNGNEDFKVKVSTDFKKQGPRDVVACFYGHYHKDSYFKEDGINFIGLPAMAYQESKIDEEIGRDGKGKNAYAFEVLQVDKSKKKLYLTRFGFGNDREYTY